MTHNKADQQVDGDRSREAKRPSPASPSQREEIARIIDPKAWLLIDHQRPRFDAANPGAEAVHVEQWQSTYGDSLAKADAILSLFPEAGEVDRPAPVEHDPEWVGDIGQLLARAETAERSLAEALAEVERLKAKLQGELTTPDGSEWVRRDRRDEAEAKTKVLSAQLEQAKEALEPFACALTDSESFVQDTGYARSLPIGHVCTEDFRRARETLSLIEKEGGHA